MVRKTGRPVHYRCADGIARLTLNEPGKRNALSVQMVAAIEEACAAAGRDPHARVLLLDAEGEHFSSGAPLELLRALAAGTAAPADIRLARALLDMPLPCIAALEGHAIGGGLALGLAADIVVMARESRYGLTFIEHGFTPGMGTTGLLEHVLSPAVAHELLYTAELRRGSDFIGSGINHVVPRAEVRAKAEDLARRIADKPRTALTLLKRTLSLPRRRRFESTHTLETLMHEVTFRSPEARQRIRDADVE